MKFTNNKRIFFSLNILREDTHSIVEVNPYHLVSTFQDMDEIGEVCPYFSLLSSSVSLVPCLFAILVIWVFHIFNKNSFTDIIIENVDSNTNISLAIIYDNNKYIMFTKNSDDSFFIFRNLLILWTNNYLLIISYFVAFLISLHDSHL